MTSAQAVILKRRTLPDRLRYFAECLADGANHAPVAVALNVLADELEEDGWNAARDRAAEYNDGWRTGVLHAARLADEEAERRRSTRYGAIVSKAFRELAALLRDQLEGTPDAT